MNNANNSNTLSFDSYNTVFAGDVSWDFGGFSAGGSFVVEGTTTNATHALVAYRDHGRTVYHTNAKGTRTVSSLSELRRAAGIDWA